MSTANQLIYAGGTVAIDTTGDVITLKNVAGDTAGIISNAQVLLSRDGNDVLSQNATTTYLSDSQGNTVLSATYNTAVPTSGKLTLTRAGDGNDILTQTNTQTFLFDPNGDAVITANYNGTIASNTLTISRGSHNNILTQDATNTYLYDSKEREILRTYVNATSGTVLELYRDGDSNLAFRKTPTSIGLYDDSEETPVVLFERNTVDSTASFYIKAWGDILTSVAYPDSTTNTFSLSRASQNKILTQDKNDTNLYDSNGTVILNAHYDESSVGNNTVTISRDGAYHVLYQDKSQTGLFDSNGDNFLSVITDSNNTGNNAVFLERPGENTILYQNATTTALFNSAGTEILTATTSAQTLLASSLSLASAPTTTTAAAVYVKGTDGKLKEISIAALKALLA
ncbi:MAG: hypothetical protein P4L28_12055 [Paludibacteraceae bacterium]|nr:hypothetical protein [Paludibacteraceae bacterium]